MGALKQLVGNRVQVGRGRRGNDVNMAFVCEILKKKKKTKEPLNQGVWKHWGVLCASRGHRKA